MARNFSSNGEEGENGAAYIQKNGDHYYLFVNWGACCNGIHSSGKIMIGRASPITGPYLDKNGQDMRKRGASPFWVVKTDI